ncbi:glycoside hydrolase N-terminal domain-containing protein [Cohnella suwonensis]|uniref:Glycoside hydrolase N-terminal domain-containing protein n=1 Tax=Cohnella suwonensis TaxID=696072 RepID=A0ABW0LSC0_9BACL
MGEQWKQSGLESGKKEWKLSYDKPATVWEEALPIGNGRLGGMVFGGADAERVALNEDTLWAGIPRDTLDYDARRYLAKSRELLFNGKNAEAQRLIEERMVGQDCQPYVPVGDLLLKRIEGGSVAKDGVSDYRRELTLSDGVATASYRADSDGALVRGEYFASVPDQVIVIRYVAEEGKLNFDVGFTSPIPCETVASDGAVLSMTGRAPSHVAENYRGDHPEPVLYEEGIGMPFEARLRATTDGRLSLGDGRLEIRDAREFTIYLAIETGFVDYRTVPEEEAFLERCRNRVDLASELGYEELLRRHAEEHSALFGRVDLVLEAGEECSDLEETPTDARLEAYKNGGADLGLEALFFQYGRYLLMASSRPGTQPANLQGIWNPHVQPPWYSDYTVNINTEMNYWLAEVGNLSECHEPLFDLLDGLSDTGGRAARVLYGCRGWTTHHNVDVWRMATPTGGSAMWAFWPLGGAWLARHLWDRYLFDRDERFLKERAYPIMKGAALFCLDWLVEGPDGLLVTNPSTSPENAFLTKDGETCSVTVGSTMDFAIIKELFASVAAASGKLGVDASFAGELTAALARLPDYRIGRHGTIQEWLEDYEEAEPGHRHISHLYGLHPGDQIHEGTPELFRAASATLARRLANGGGHTGWSCAWLINQFARLKDSKQAYANLRTLLSKSTYPNLFDAHPPFQIDGNFGGAAGMAEMLLQSHLDAIELLPALPEAWKDGAVRGLKARGGYTVDMRWENGALKEATLAASHDGACRIRYGAGAVFAVTDCNGTAVACEGGEFRANAGETYVLNF